MKTFLDFIPILLFFAAYKLHYLFGIPKDEAIYFATPVLMAATVAQMAIIRQALHHVEAHSAVCRYGHCAGTRNMGMEEQFP